MELTWQHMINLLIVIAVVVVIVLVIPGQAYHMVKNAMNKLFGNEEISNEEAIANYETVVNIYTACFASKQTDCVCFKGGFPQFPKDSALGFYETEETHQILLTTVENKEPKVSKQSLVNGSFGCWLSYTKDSQGEYITRTERGLSMHFDKSKKYLIGTQDKIGSLPLDFPFLYKTKSGSVCFVLNEMITNKAWYQGDFFPGVKEQRTALQEKIKSLPICS